MRLKCKTNLATFLLAIAVACNTQNTNTLDEEKQLQPGDCTGSHDHYCRFLCNKEESCRLSEYQCNEVSQNRCGESDFCAAYDFEDFVLACRMRYNISCNNVLVSAEIAELIKNGAPGANCCDYFGSENCPKTYCYYDSCGPEHGRCRPLPLPTQLPANWCGPGECLEEGLPCDEENFGSDCCSLSCVNGRCSL